MRVRMPKVPDNFAPQVLPVIPEADPDQPIITEEVLIAPPPTNTQHETIEPPHPAPTTSFADTLTRSTKRTRKSPKYYGYDEDDSSGDSTNSCPPNFAPPVGSVEWVT